MPYIPNLIPKEYQVLPEYFNTKNPVNQQGQKPPSPLWWLVAAILATSAILSLNRPGIAVILTLIVLLCTPYGKRKLEGSARFRLTTKLRLMFCFVLLLSGVPLTWYYKQAEAAAAIQKEVLHQQVLTYTADSLRQEHLREDSLYLVIKQSQSLPLNAAWIALVNADRFSKTSKDRGTLTQARHLVALNFSNQLIKEGHYEQAQTLLADQFKREPGSPSLLYNRALCYYRTGNIQQAVSDLDSARSNGYKEAGKLYNKLNPLKKRVAFYCTLCCDGTTSDATGRGACSWHGGVCQWNHPVYETYRKYPSNHDSL